MKAKSTIIDTIRHPKKLLERHTEKDRLNYRVCPYCHGSGLDNNNPVTPLTMQPQNCTVCGGSGRVPI